MATNGSGFRNIIVVNVSIGAANKNVRRELAANNGNIGRQVHPQHGQHTSLLLAAAAAEMVVVVVVVVAAALVS